MYCIFFRFFFFKAVYVIQNDVQTTAEPEKVAVGAGAHTGAVDFRA
jgi:hypothetical protein